MSTYSVYTDLDSIVPGASTGWLFASADVATEYPKLAEPAYNEINGFLAYGTATPVTDTDLLPSLREIECLLVAHRRASALYATRDQEASEGFRSDFRARAMGVLNTLVFPASVSVPEKTPASFDAGDRELAVSVFDGFTAPGRWLLVCTNPGAAADAQLSLWSSRADSYVATWKLSDGLSWPVDVDPLADPRGLYRQLRLTITGSADFAEGDAWSFRTYGRWKRKLKRGIRMIDTRRSGA